jgi:hypothetical protein
MEVRMQGKNGPVVKNVAEMLAQVREQLQQEQAQWLKQLRDNPGGFADLEMAVHQTFQRLADQTMAGLLAQVTAQDGFAKDQKKSTC